MANYVLEILDGDRAGDVHPVAQAPLRIGRKPGNDVVLADEKTSGVHAEIALEGDRHVLRDLGSTNGTFLDGKRVTELVLTPGDVVTIGRIRVRFRDAEAAGGAAAADSGEFAVHRLDASRVGKRGGSLGAVAALLLLGAAAGGYFWWQGQGGGGGGEAAPQPVPPLAVAGNKLAAGTAACDGEEGWNLRAAGAGFQPTTRRHTGAGAFEAVRGDGAEAPDFALLQLQEPLPVFAGRTLTLAAHLRSEGAARVALRAVCFAAAEGAPFRFRTGTPLRAAEGWQRVETTVTVPAGCDRLQVEVVAVLPGAGALGAVDDVAVTEAGAAASLDHTLAESSQTALGTGAALAIRSTDPENPATLLAVLPDAVPAELQGLQRAGLCCLSDLGAALTAAPDERSFAVAATGVERLQLVFPAEAAGGLLVAADGAAGFRSAAADSEFPAAALLLGDRATRLLVRLDAPAAAQGRTAGGLYRLSLAANRCQLVLGFRAELQQAGALLRQARARLADGEPGQALDVLRDLAATAPHDSETLQKALQLRAEILAAQQEQLQRLQTDLAEASFFETRGGFERVVRGVDALVQRYGEANLEDAAGAAALRAAAAAKLQAIDQAQFGPQRARLEALQQALLAAQQPGLAGLIQDHLQRLPAGR